MGCEDCKNYEPEGKAAFKVFKAAINDAIGQVCWHHVCSNCPLGPTEKDCIKHEIRQIVRRKAKSD